MAEEIARAGAENLDHAHVRHVEHPGIAPHCVVLFDLRPVMKGHLPPGELDQPGVRATVLVDQGGVSRRVHAKNR